MQSIVIHENIREISQPYVIYYLGDVHLGAANCNEHALKNAVKMIQEDANAWIGVGDYIDAISYNDLKKMPTLGLELETISMRFLTMTPDLILWRLQKDMRFET